MFRQLFKVFWGKWELRHERPRSTGLASPGRAEHQAHPRDRGEPPSAERLGSTENKTMSRQSPGVARGRDQHGEAFAGDPIRGGAPVLGTGQGQARHCSRGGSGHAEGGSCKKEGLGRSVSRLVSEDQKED